MSKIISICSEKCGVGKTTTTVNVAGGLAQLGKKVLVIDLDQQQNASRTLGYIKDGKPTISELIYNEVADIKTDFSEIIRHSENGIDYIPSSPMLTNITSTMANDEESNYVIKRILSNAVFAEYDYILLDSEQLCTAVFLEIKDFEYRGWTCEKGLAHEYIYPGAIEFSDSTLLCTNVTMYPSASGIFFSASANAVPETDYAYQSRVQRQLDQKIELDKRNGNTAYGKNGIDIFQNLNTGAEDVRKKATVVTAFRSEV